MRIVEAATESATEATTGGALRIRRHR